MTVGGTGPWTVIGSGVLRAAGHPFEWIESLGFCSTARLIREVQEAKENLSGVTPDLCDRIFRLIPGSPKGEVRSALLSIRRDIHNLRFPATKKREVALGWLSQQEPDVAITLGDYFGTIERISELERRIAGSFEVEMNEARKNLARILEDESFIESVMLLSPDMFERLLSFRERIRSLPAVLTKSERQMESTIMAYLQRGCTRVVPLNTMASYADCEAGENEEAEIGIPAGPLRRTRTRPALPKGVLRAIERRLLEELVSSGKEHLLATPCRFERNGKISWFVSDDSGMKLQSSEETDLMRLFLELANGTRNRRELLQLVTEDLGEDAPSYEELEAFARRMADVGLLKICPRLFTRATDFGELRDTVERMTGTRFESLHEVSSAIDGYSREGNCASKKRLLGTIETALDRFLGQREPYKSILTFEEGIRFEKLGLGCAYRRKVERDFGAYLDLLIGLGVGTSVFVEGLRSFRKEFPEGAPLVDLFSAPLEMGAEIGAMSIKSLESFYESTEGTACREFRDRFESWFAGHVQRGRDGTVIPLAEFFEALGLDLPALIPGVPYAQTVQFRIGAEDLDAFRSGRGEVYLQATRPGWGHYISRFGQSPDLSALLKASAGIAKTAEILASRNLNVPLDMGADYDIEDVDCVSDRPPDKRLLLVDLDVRPSGGVLPFKICNASTGETLIPLYSFMGTHKSNLAELAAFLSPTFLWLLHLVPSRILDPERGISAEDVEFIPEIRTGDAVLFPKVWLVKLRVLLPIFDKPSIQEQFAEMVLWRRRNNIPRYVCVNRHQEDTRSFRDAFFDLEDPLFLPLISREIRKLAKSDSDIFCFREMVPGPDQLWLQDDRGHYVTEFAFEIGRVRGEGEEHGPSEARKRAG